MTHARYKAEELLLFARTLLERAGLEADKVAAVAEVLLEGDLLGHTTHGLHLLAAYLADIEQGGLDDFVRQTGWLAQACRTTPPRPGVERVRLPGENGLARRADQLAHGVDLYASILPSLEPWSKKLGVALPRPL